MKKKLWIIGVVLLIGYLLVFTLSTHESAPRILYSWDLQEIMDNASRFETILKEYQINTLYQSFSEEYLKEFDSSFLKIMKEKKIKVYHLAGDPSWGKENGFSKIKEEVDLLLHFNQNSSNQIEGIVLDIEPYVNEKEEQFENQDFENYVQEIKQAYHYIHSKQLELILAIPYWFDVVYESLLEELIQNTDGISVMNYDITKTSENLKTEIKLAEKYQKKIDTIYEVNYQEKDYFSSRDEIEIDYKKIKKENRKKDLGIAFHYYRSMK